MSTRARIGTLFLALFGLALPQLTGAPLPHGGEGGTVNLPGARSLDMNAGGVASMSFQLKADQSLSLVLPVDMPTAVAVYRTGELVLATSLVQGQLTISAAELELLQGVPVLSILLVSPDQDSALAVSISSSDGSVLVGVASGEADN